MQNAECRMMKPEVSPQPTAGVRLPYSPVPPSPQGLPPSLKLWWTSRWAGCRPSSVVRRPSFGFSLVEVTLALMVMAIGILSIMSLFPAGLDQNARSIADTHAAFFAEEVFGGLHATAETNWAGLANVSLPVAARYDMWPDVTNQIQVTGTNITTIVYKYTPSAITYEDHALRYRLALTNNGLLKAATLWVWPGEFGSTNDPSIFYAEFFRWKPL